VVEGRGGDKTYRIGPNKECGNYPLIYEPQVTLQCARSTEGKCSRERPGICVCKKSRVCKERPFIALDQASKELQMRSKKKVRMNKFVMVKGHPKKGKKRKKKKQGNN
jgi:hypothetical protein